MAKFGIKPQRSFYRKAKNVLKEFNLKEKTKGSIKSPIFSRIFKLWKLSFSNTFKGKGIFYQLSCLSAFMAIMPINQLANQPSCLLAIISISYQIHQPSSALTIMLFNHHAYQPPSCLLAIMSISHHQHSLLCLSAIMLINHHAYQLSCLLAIMNISDHAYQPSYCQAGPSSISISKLKKRTRADVITKYKYTHHHHPPPTS